jgi:SEC-C motif-containing protein
MREELCCPCGLPQTLNLCCGRWLAQGAAPLGAPDAATLMRSRYTAFVLQDAPYLLATWHPRTRPPRVDFEPGLKWLGLEVKQHRPIDADHAEVRFVARSKLGGRAHRLQETSRFVREDGQWLYVDGDIVS